MITPSCANFRRPDDQSVVFLLLSLEDKKQSAHLKSSHKSSGCHASPLWENPCVEETQSKYEVVIARALLLLVAK